MQTTPHQSRPASRLGVEPLASKRSNFLEPSRVVQKRLQGPFPRAMAPQISNRFRRFRPACRHRSSRQLLQGPPLRLLAHTRSLSASMPGPPLAASRPRPWGSRLIGGHLKGKHHGAVPKFRWYHEGPFNCPCPGAYGLLVARKYAGS